MEIASFLPLVGLGLMHRTFSITTNEVALKYALFNLFCALLFLLGMYIYYALIGSVDFSYIETYVRYCDLYTYPNSIFQFLITLGALLMLSSFFFKLGFFPFNGLLADIYKTMSFSLFSAYATFYNFGVFLTFLYLLTGPFFFLLPSLQVPLTVIFLLTVLSSVLGSLHSDFTLRSTIGFLSAGSISLSLVVFIGAVDSEIAFFDALAHLVGGVFFYTVGLYLFLSLLDTITHAFSKLKFKNFLDLASMRLYLPGLSFLIFLMSGLPPTAVFFFKFFVFTTSSNVLFLFFIVFFQIVFLCVYVRLLTTYFSDGALLESTQFNFFKTPSNSFFRRKALVLSFFSIFFVFASFSQFYFTVGERFLEILFF